MLVTLSMGITLITSLLSVFTYAGGSLSTLFNFISANLISSATIHSSDVTYLYVMRFLAANKISTDCRLFCVTSRKNPQSHAVRRYSSYPPYGDGGRAHDEEDDDDVDPGYGSEHDDLGPKLKYGPAPGMTAPASSFSLPPNFFLPFNCRTTLPVFSSIPAHLISHCGFYFGGITLIIWTPSPDPLGPEACAFRSEYCACTCSLDAVGV